MKIFFMCAALTSGGAERVISILANEFAKEGHEVEIIMYFNGEVWYKISPKVKIVVEEKEINKGNSNVLNHLLWRRKYIKENKPDVVISFLATFNIITILSMMGLKVPLIVADRSDPRYAPKNGIIRGVRNFLYNFADKIILQSNYNKDYFQKSIQKKSTIIMNPIGKSPMYQKAIMTKKQKKIVTVGRVIIEKNPDMALEVFRGFHENHPDYVFEIYGDGNLKERMEKKVIDLGLGEFVFYKGRVKDIYTHIVDAKAYILTSNYEGMPNSLIEAMYVGLPVVSTKVSGATDLIKHGENGFLVDCGDTEAMKLCLEKIIVSEEESQSIGLKASLTVKNLEVEKIIEQWKKIIY